KKLHLFSFVALVSTYAVYAYDTSEERLRSNITAWHEVLDSKQCSNCEYNEYEGEEECCDVQEPIGDVHGCAIIDAALQEEALISDLSTHQYDQHICDHVAPQKVSDTMALLREFGIAVLIKLLAAKERFSLCCAQIKDHVSRFFGL